MYSAIKDETAALCTLISTLLATTAPQGDTSRSFIIRGVPGGVCVSGSELWMNEGPVWLRLVGDGGTVC